MESKTTKSTSVVHTVQRNIRAESAVAAEDCFDARLPQRLFAAVAASQSEPELIRAVLDTIREALGLATIAYLRRRADGRLELCEAEQLGQSLPPAATETLIAWGNETAERGNVQFNTLPGAFRWTVITVPTIMSDRAPEILLAAIRAGSRSAKSIASALQLAATQFTIWHHEQAVRRANSDAKNSAALLELMGKLDESENLTQASYCLVNETCEYLDCERVVLGLTGKHRTDCRVVAISGLSGFDKRSELTRTIEAALNETVLRAELTELIEDHAGQATGTLALEKLKTSVNAKMLISSPLRNQRGEVIGAWIVIDSSAFDAARKVEFIRCSEAAIGSKIQAIQRASANRLWRWCTTIAGRAGSRKLSTGLVVLICLVAALFVPMDYRIGCECQLEPVSRRFIAAPYDGTLEEALVEAGDVVQAGQVLARMDARELRWELAGLEADYKSEQKTRDAAAARDEVALAQQSNLQMQRLQLQMQLIHHRLENLEVKSPIDGVVIAGDMKKAEGAPLSIGQTVFEIGPLDQMIVEIAIPERDVLHVKTGMDVQLRLDAAMQTTEVGTVSRITPRSDIRESESVYVAELYLPNRDGRLRPGMKGTAKIVSDRHTLGWILFHKAWESLAMKIGW